ncbi:MAG: site-2 protease family protein [Emergencia sp.]|nr:site-2 protease family protein [Emergencia sp.]
MKNFFKSPMVLLLLVLVVLRVVTNPYANAADWLMDKLIILPGIIIGLSFHEFAHGIVSHALGDPTPKMQGRLTINPAAHMDPLGFLALLFAGFGWGVPVQVDPRYYKHRRLGEILVSFAGVAMNFLIAIIFTLVIRIGFEINPMWFYSGMGETVLQILSGIISINIVLMVFNLLPVPPLDGFGIVTEIFNLRKYNWYYTVYNNGMLILLALIIFNVTDRILTPSVSFIYSWLMNVIIL